MRRLCVRLGLDPAEAKFGWGAVTDEQKEKEIHPMQYASQNTLYESEGVIAGRAARNADFGDVEREWKEEFGEDPGLVEEMVGLAMPRYRYLYERRWDAGNVENA